MGAVQPPCWQVEWRRRAYGRTSGLRYPIRDSVGLLGIPSDNVPKRIHFVSWQTRTSWNICTGFASEPHLIDSPSANIHSAFRPSVMSGPWKCVYSNEASFPYIRFHFGVHAFEYNSICRSSIGLYLAAAFSPIGCFWGTGKLDSANCSIIIYRVNLKS